MIRMIEIMSLMIVLRITIIMRMMIQTTTMLMIMILSRESMIFYDDDYLGTSATGFDYLLEENGNGTSCR